jgi:hypothetical protein
VSYFWLHPPLHLWTDNLESLGSFQAFPQQVEHRQKSCSDDALLAILLLLLPLLFLSIIYHHQKDLLYCPHPKKKRKKTAGFIPIQVYI